MGVASATLTAENTFTDHLSATWRNFSGNMNVSISGTFVGTVTVQRRMQTDGGSGTYGDWVDVASYTAPAERQLTDTEDSNQYRIGIKTGNYTSGSAVCRLST